jgi:hypothetical protein
MGVRHFVYIFKMQQNYNQALSVNLKNAKHAKNSSTEHMCVNLFLARQGAVYLKCCWPFSVKWELLGLN